MYVLGTAGHVDHGKSTLIERLTGIDPDRLAEEKERGLTIDLGFAWLTLPSGREVGVVDVPGHERFVHNMLAGVGSIDATIFVVAANEGWKPQSEEHLAILDLLGARGGVVALTKRDLVADTERDAVVAEIRDRIAGTALDDAPIIPVSAIDGEGIDDLVAAIDAMLDRTPPTPDHDRPRLFVDRSFSMKGAGTVVTGTLTGGFIRVEDDVEVLPAHRRARVRSVQSHKRQRDVAEPGTRIALNLAGLDRAAVARGDAIVRAGQWRATNMIDVLMRPVRALDATLSGRGAFKLYVGSTESDVRIRFLDPSRLSPGGEAFARLTPSHPVVAAEFDRFVIRDAGRERTVAGGIVLDPHPAGIRLGDTARARRIEELRARRDAGREELARLIVDERGVVPVADLRWLTGAAATGGPLRGYAVSGAWLARATTDLERALADFHAAEPLARGMPRDRARTALKIADAKLFSALVDALRDRVVAEDTHLRLAGHRVRLSPEQEAARERLLSELDAAGLAPPGLDDLARAHGAALVSALVASGDLVKVARDLAFARDSYDQARKQIADAIGAEGPLTTSRIREILGTSRKYAVPLLEHLDAIGFTKRREDVRVLAGPAA